MMKILDIYLKSDFGQFMSINVSSTSIPSQDVSEEVSQSVGVARKSVKITKYINQIQWSI